MENHILLLCDKEICCSILQRNSFSRYLIKSETLLFSLVAFYGRGDRSWLRDFHEAKHCTIAVTILLTTKKRAVNNGNEKTSCRWGLSKLPYLSNVRKDNKLSLGSRVPFDIVISNFKGPSVSRPFHFICLLPDSLMLT